MKREYIVTEGDTTSIVDRRTGQELAFIQVGEPISSVQGNMIFVFKIKLNQITEMDWGKEKTQNVKRLVEKISDNKPTFLLKLPGVRNLLARLGIQ